ncbi:polar localization protein TipN [Caulobacter endophyticus]|uniref:polar localization protein TipN n=1 Tax=Caulobacter endophyticus TaxID=2172652 RepID=UPI00240F2824|nr:polar localization protein TipN [Caulobacter endophyticus]MDG2530634.1 polar localization protein TipN [Caulobacter endophyticus]
MKPKKRRPLDFSTLPVETPRDDAAPAFGLPESEPFAAAEPDPDAPVSEPDNDLDIADLPEAGFLAAPPRGARPPSYQPPEPQAEAAPEPLTSTIAPEPEPAPEVEPEPVVEPTPEPFEPPLREDRSTARRSFFRGSAPLEPIQPEPEPVAEAPPSPPEPMPEFAPPPEPRSRRTRTVERSPADDLSPLPTFLTAPAAAQPPAPRIEPEPPAKSEPAPRPPAQERPVQTLSEKADRKPMPGGLYWSLAVCVAALWAVAPVLFALGYGPSLPLPITMAVFAALAAGPAAFILLAAYMLRQAMGVSAELRRTRQLTDQLLTPATLAAAGATGVVDALSGQIDAATSAADAARERIVTLRQALAEETARLVEAADSSSRMAKQLAEGLGHERSAMQALSATLDTQSTAVVDAIGSQARMVAEASDLAETQLREAEAALAARAADLAAAAAEASDAARVGAEDLSRQIARLETAGQGVGDQIGSVERSLASQRAALVAAAQALRADQEDFSSETETRTAQLTEFVAYTRVGASELGDIAAMGAEVLRGLIVSSGDQLREMAEAARAEREALAAETQAALARLEAAAADRRGDLEGELTRAMNAIIDAAQRAGEGVELRVETARGRVDQLNEIAFSAGQKADAVFESRMQEARDLIENAAQVVEQAGARTAQKLAESVETARTAIAEMERLLVEAGQSSAALPGEALARAAEVRAQIEKGIDDLRAAARRTAEETAAIDQAFQDRVRRNYEMLSEAVTQMNAAAAQTPSFAAPPQSRGASALVRPPQPAAQPAPQPAPQAPPPQQRQAPPPAPVQPAPQPPRAQTPPPVYPNDDFAPLEPPPRQRLKLTPTATDDEFRTMFDAAGGRGAAPAPPEPAQDEGGWSWKNLLGDMQGSSPGDAALGEKLAGEILAMGIDPSALLPRGRIDEIAAAIQTHDEAGAREVVKKLAPAAIRRLVRRLFSDATLKANAERFVRRYAGMVSEAAQQDREGFLVAALLASEAGRAYLLLDAAASDLA